MRYIYKFSFIAIVFLFIFTAILVFLRVPEKEFKGYLVKDTGLFVYFADFPSFWSSFKKDNIAISASKHLFNYFYDIELFFRKRFGIRPTPLRWKIWAGKPLLISWNTSGDYLLSFKPSLLFRLFILPSLNIKNAIEINKTDTETKFYYLWKGEELLISNTETTFNQIIPFTSKPLNMSKSMACIRIEKGLNALLFIHAENKLFMDGKIILDKWVEDNFLNLTNFQDSNLSFAFPYKPIISLLSETYIKNLVISPLPEKVSQPLFIWLSSFKNTSIEKLYHQFLQKKMLENAILFYNRTSEKFSNPIPEFGLWFPYEKNNIQYLLSELDLDWQYYIKKWGPYKGYIVPIWNNAFCLSLLYYQKGWLICSQEPLMAKIVDLIGESKNNQRTSRILTVNFSQLSDDLEKIFLWGAQKEFIIDINERDMTNLFSPWKEFFKEIGTFTINTRTIQHDKETSIFISGGFTNEN